MSEPRDIVEVLRRPLETISQCRRMRYVTAEVAEIAASEIDRLREERREVAWGVMFPDGDVIPFEERKTAEQAMKSANARIAMAGGSPEDRLRMVALSIQPPPEDQ